MRKILILLVVFIASWDLLWWLAGIQPLSPRSLRNSLERTDHRPVLLDVRTWPEFVWLHIPEAGSYPRLLLHPEDLPPDDAEKPIVVICLSGHRSPVTAYRLKQRGFRDVSYLAWGMISWLISGGPTIKGG